MAEEKKPMATTQQKESHGKEKANSSKSQKDSYFKETITVQKVN